LKLGKYINEYFPKKNNKAFKIKINYIHEIKETAPTEAENIKEEKLKKKRIKLN